MNIVKTCPKCGNELLPEALFCTNCGTKISMKNDIPNVAAKERIEQKSYLLKINNIKKNLLINWRKICKWIIACIIILLAIINIAFSQMLPIEENVFSWGISLIAIVLIYLWTKSKKTNIINTSINVVTLLFVIVTFISLLIFYTSYAVQDFVIKNADLYSNRRKLDEQLCDLNFRNVLLKEANFGEKNYFNLLALSLPKRWQKMGFYDWEYLAAWKEAMLGSCIEQYSLGYFFECTQISEKGLERAYNWYEKAASKTIDSKSNTSYQSYLGCVISEIDAKTEALNSLAKFYYFGFYVPRNHQMTVKYLEESANLGNKEATYRLGSHYEEGDGVEQDYKKAFKYYFKIKDDSPYYQFKIGSFYLEGKGVKKNNKLALEWLNRAVDNGIPQAQCLLGELYLKGEIIPQDINKARQLLEAAKKSGLDRAVFLLQEMKKNKSIPK